MPQSGYLRKNIFRMPEAALPVALGFLVARRAVRNRPINTNTKKPSIADSLNLVKNRNTKHVLRLTPWPCLP